MYFDNAIVYYIHPQTKIHFWPRVICNVKQNQWSAYSLYFIERFFYMIHRSLDFGKRERIKLSNFPYAFDSGWSPRENILILWIMNNDWCDSTRSKCFMLWFVRDDIILKSYCKFNNDNSYRKIKIILSALKFCMVQQIIFYVTY